MSMLGDLGDAIGDDLSGGAIAYSRGAWLWGAASRGESFTSAYQAMVGTPIGMRREQALSLWQDIQTTLTEASAAGAIGFDQLADPAAMGEAPANWTGQYVYRVNFTTRTLDDDGTYRLESTPKWMISGSVLTPEDAVSAAQNLIELPAGIGTPDAIDPGSVIMANLSGAWFRTRPGVLGGLG